MKIVNALNDHVNLPGVELILILPVVTNYEPPPSYDVSLHNAIDLSMFAYGHPDFDKWIPIYHTLDTGILEEESISTDHGPLFKYSIECFVPRDFAYRQKQFYELAHLEHYILVKDQNGLMRLLGYTEEFSFSRGAQFRWKQSTGSGSKDRNGYKISLKFESDIKALPVTNFDSIPIETGWLV